MVALILTVALFVVVYASTSIISPAKSRGESSARSLVTRRQDTGRFHIAFSTGCSPRQDWQSYATFFSAEKVHQPGTLTRIASGCTTVRGRTGALKARAHRRLEVCVSYRLKHSPPYLDPGRPSRRSSSSSIASWTPASVYTSPPTLTSIIPTAS